MSTISSSHRTGPRTLPAKSRPSKVLPSACFALVFFLSVASVAGASSTRRISLKQRVLQADLIVDATVIKVVHRNAIPATVEQSPTPFTYVTFKINRTMKGAVDGAELTLRKLGGPDGFGNRVELVGTPEFQVGDRDVLFVCNNGVEFCPIVGWKAGRLRVVDGQVYSHDGREVWLSAAGDLVAGRRTLDVGRFPYRALGGPNDTCAGHESHEPFTPSVGSIRPDVDGLGEVLIQMTEVLLASKAMKLPKVTASLDPNVPFVMPSVIAERPAAGPARTDKLDGAPLFRGEYDENEARLIREARGSRR